MTTLSEGHESMKTTPDAVDSDESRAVTLHGVSVKTPGKNLGFLDLAERYALPLIFVVVFVFFSIREPDTFPTASNIQVLLASQAISLVIALALLVPLVAGHFDISVGAVAVLSSIAMASMHFTHGWPLLVSVLAAMGIAVMIGAANGLLVAYVGINGLIATIGTSFILTGLITWYTDGVSIMGTGSDLLEGLGIRETLGLPRLVWVGAIVAVLVGYLLTQTPMGRRLVSIGSNPDAARLVGIPVKRFVFGTYIVSSLLGAVAGLLLLAQQGSGNPAANGLSMALPALAAVFLGASAFRPGQFNVPGTVVGLLLVAVFVSGLTLSGARPWVQPVLEGASLVIAVGVSALFRLRRLGGAS